MSNNINDSGNKCNVCKQPGQSRCSDCKLIYYCSKEHQKRDWKSHKAFCKPYMIKEDEILGRHLVATRDIKGGDVIIKEAPLIWGPSRLATSCLGCGRGLSKQRPACCQHRCQKCGWPMCSDICQNASAHLPECFYTVNRNDCNCWFCKIEIGPLGVINPFYQYVMPLRCLYNKQFSTKIWSKIETLQSHCEELNKNKKYERDRKLVALAVKRTFKLDVDEEDLLKIYRIIDLNGFEVPLTDSRIVAIYHKASMLEHNCKPNCSKTFTAEREIIIIAGVQGIKKGEHLSICYTDPLWGTVKRRRHLHETKYFWCQCQRCADVTEFGTFFSCIKCTDKSCQGMSTPKSFLEDGVPWECNKCHKVTSHEEVNNLLEDLGKKKVEMEEGSTSAAKAFISQAEIYLPSTHYYITEVKIALMKLLDPSYTRTEGWDQLCDDDLMLKLKICEDVLSLLQDIAPAENQIRGSLLFEMQPALAKSIQRKETKGEAGPDYLKLSLMESIPVLLQAVEALKHEPILTHEGQICEGARKILKTIGDIFGLSIM